MGWGWRKLGESVKTTEDIGKKVQVLNVLSFAKGLQQYVLRHQFCALSQLRIQKTSVIPVLLAPRDKR